MTNEQKEAAKEAIAARIEEIIQGASLNVDAAASPSQEEAFKTNGLDDL